MVRLGFGKVYDGLGKGRHVPNHRARNKRIVRQEVTCGAVVSEQSEYDLVFCRQYAT